MNNVYWNDLPPLSDINTEIESKADDYVFYNDDDIADFKESILYFIDEFLTSNIKLFKHYDFESVLFDSIYDIITNNYSTIIDELENDIESIIYDSIQIYFYKNSSFRSYAGTTIIKKPNKKDNSIVERI